MKNKRGFMKLARNGEEDHARRRLGVVRELLAAEPPKDPETVSRTDFLNHGIKAEKKARRSYRKYGRIPQGVEVDLEAVQALVDERDRCRGAKDFDQADLLRDQLDELGGDEWGISIRDRQRTWSVVRKKPLPKPAKKPKTAVKAKAEGGTPAAKKPQAKTSPSPTPAQVPSDTKDDKAVSPIAPADGSTAPANAPSGFEWGATF